MACLMSRSRRNHSTSRGEYEPAANCTTTSTPASDEAGEGDHAGRRGGQHVARRVDARRAGAARLVDLRARGCRATIAPATYSDGRRRSRLCRYAGAVGHAQAHCRASNPVGPIAVTSRAAPGARSACRPPGPRGADGWRRRRGAPAWRSRRTSRRAAPRASGRRSSRARSLTESPQLRGTRTLTSTTRPTPLRTRRSSASSPPVTGRSRRSGRPRRSGSSPASR